MNNRFKIVKEKGGWTILNRMGDVFQEGFESEQEAKDFLEETFG